MSVVGIDFGNLNTVIAVARNRGIDVICNEVSNRLTPTMISFGPKARHIGEGAKTLEISNFKNTLASLKRLLGCRFDDPKVHDIESQYLNCQLVPDEAGLVAVQVQSQGQDQVFTLVQLVAMFFSKVKEITEAALGSSNVCDVVISVPGYYTDAQRRAIFDAAEIAGLNILRLMNETTASAICYGIPKTDLPESSKPKHVCFVDMGQSSYSVAIVAFTKGRLEVKSTAYDMHFGGRDFDEALTQHFIKEFDAKYKMDIGSSRKAVYRLRGACERVKKVLSANSKTMLNVENLMNDKDVSAEITRSTMEELCAGLLSRVEGPLQRALAEASMTPADVDEIEVIGGSTRIAAIKERLAAFFGKDVSMTLNQDEAVARGCAFQCAILSPTFKVKEFHVQDVTPYNIRLSWESTSEDPDDKEIIIFPTKNIIPCTKLLTLNRKEPFEIHANYAESADSAFAPCAAPIGKFVIQNVVASSNGRPSTVKVKVRLNPSGIFNVENAHMIEELEDEPPSMPAEAEGQGAVDTSPTADATESLPTPTAPLPSKKLVKKIELPVSTYTASLPKSTLATLRELEMNMAANDRLVADTEERKNALEEYIYDMRSKIDAGGDYSDYMPESDKTRLKEMLQSVEDWLYSDGSDATKSVYVSKLAELQKISSPVVELFKEAEAREYAVKTFQETCSKLMTQAQTKDEKYNHITLEEREKVSKEVEAKMQWLHGMLEKQNNTVPKHVKPVITAAAIKQELEKLVTFSTSVFNKPLPPPPPAAAAPSKPSAEPSPSIPVEVTNMDVD